MDGGPSAHPTTCMIVKCVFHTYKDDFPIIVNDHYPSPYNLSLVDNMMTNQIIELSDFTKIGNYIYITRHTNDKIPNEEIVQFITKFSSFVNFYGNNPKCGLPTIWLVVHFESYDSIKEAKEKLLNKKILSYESITEIESFKDTNDSYWDDVKDAYLFPKFLHQVTMIGIDLLKDPNVINELKQLKSLEWLLYRNPANKISDLKRMRDLHQSNSQYYREEIFNKGSESIEFWQNFEKVKIKDLGNNKMHLGSWPHFLFNICGVSLEPAYWD